MVSRALMTPLSTITRMENHGEDSMIAQKLLKEITQWTFAIRNVMSYCHAQLKEASLFTTVAN